MQGKGEVSVFWIATSAKWWLLALRMDGEVSCLRERDREARSDEEEREIEEWS